MRSTTPARAAWLAALALSMTFCTSAHAQLGGTRAALAGMPAARALTQSNGAEGALSITTTVDDGGTTIREYATANGRIVAYTWDGPTMPDLHKLLGARFESFQSGAATSLNRHAGRVQQGDFVVESGGQMRSYIGRAWLPGALPAGVSIDDLR
ncbi:DUF2844 domain-containing protein [Trinickia violacea]|uniref:DUF2844 domain-containing protein n=1 Tax=Trinickia violacea TaxID=2571746 RepID=A0A4P8IQQ9_9BURK|nr:DUF2844 domain-containing protein [Trinickia violacea]QCP49985.1 DUF2844 domain-containing protein [Trinickia violacea]